MVLKICQYGDAVLRKKAIPVERVTREAIVLAQDMLDTMYNAKGVGLAAQQIGRLEKMCVIDIPEGAETEEDERFNAPIEMPLVLFNPEIIAQKGSQHDKEGCLSFPKIGGSVTRAEEVSCQYLDCYSRPQIITARGFLARALQHEIDHLNGILYIDHLSEEEKSSFSLQLKKMAKKNGGVC